MKDSSSRRRFLKAGLALSAAGSGIPISQAAQAADTPKLTYRTLGKTGLRVTSVSFGCMTTSDQSVIERAADIGINYFDTARAYQNGNNERMVGAALKGKRQKVVISSKSGGKTRQAALEDLDTSLRELGTDYLDIWYLHSRNDPSDVTDELLEAQQAAKKAGKIRFAGISTHFNMDRMLAYLTKLGRTDVVLTTYNFSMQSVSMTNQPARQADMTAAIEAAGKTGLGIVAMKAMAGGVNRISRGDRLYGANPEAMKLTITQEGAALAALKWTLKNEALGATIVAMADHDQLDENLRAMSEPYSDKDERLLATQLARISPLYCRMCGACGGVCDRGVPVPAVLRILTYADGYGQFSLARERFLELPREARTIRCQDCDSCSVNCPNGVRVQERLIRAQSLFV